MSLLRYIPGAGLFTQPSATEHTDRRQAEAEQLAEYHRQKAVELQDAAAWAAAQQAHHERMAVLYRERALPVVPRLHEVQR